MNKRPYRVWLGVGLALVVAFAGGVYVGVILGIEEFQNFESSAKASVLTTELRALRAGNVERIIQTKEVEVDGNVVRALAFQESGMPWLFWPYVHSWDHTPSLKRVAQYRKQHPPIAPTIAPPAGTDDPADLRGFADEVTRSTKVLIERYGR